MQSFAARNYEKVHNYDWMSIRLEAWRHNSSLKWNIIIMMFTRFTKNETFIIVKSRIIVNSETHTIYEICLSYLEWQMLKLAKTYISRF